MPPRPETYDDRRYLAAKVTVDDRALNARVWSALASVLPRATRETPLRVIELGAGIGTMVQRVLTRDLLDYAVYRAVDLDPENTAEAARRLRAWGASAGYDVSNAGATGLTLAAKDGWMRVDLETADVSDFLARERDSHAADLVIAQAFLDLVNVDAVLPGVLSLLKPGGLLYFTINFDGMTLFEPEIDRELDAYIEALYHETMDARGTPSGRSGGSRTGRRLFAHLMEAGAEIMEIGSSDWVVYPRAGSYEADEAYFLHHIVNTVWEALRGHSGVDRASLAAWIDRRHVQIERGEMVYVAHQLDYLARAPV